MSSSMHTIWSIAQSITSRSSQMKPYKITTIPTLTTTPTRTKLHSYPPTGCNNSKTIPKLLQTRCSESPILPIQSVCVEPASSQQCPGNYFIIDQASRWQLTLLALRKISKAPELKSVTLFHKSLLTNPVLNFTLRNTGMVSFRQRSTIRCIDWRSTHTDTHTDRVTHMHIALRVLVPTCRNFRTTLSTIGIVFAPAERSAEQNPGSCCRTKRAQCPFTVPLALAKNPGHPKSLTKDVRNL